MNKIVLIDGHAILHRAYHALPPLSNKEGLKTNAVYGFFSMFLKIVEDLKPEYVVVCFDRPKPTFRKSLYVGYQAHRPPMESDLMPQIDLVKEKLSEIKIETFELDGYEADDLIGTISEQVHNDTQVIIVSGDRDLLQLVNSHVFMLAPVTGMTKMTLFDGEKVEEKYGLKPKQIVDYKALVGDASDNYPGVSGIGPKTACDLLRKYENFENLYKHLAEIPEKTSLKLAQDAEQAALAKKLATIVTDAPIKFELDKASVDKLDRKKLLAVFEELGFKSLISRVTSLKQESKKDEKKDKNEQLGLL